MQIKELMGWLSDTDIPIGSTLTFTEIEQLEFYRNIPDSARSTLIYQILTQLASQDKLVVKDKTVTKLDFISLV